MGAGRRAEHKAEEAKRAAGIEATRMRIEEENRHLLKKRAAIIKLREQEVLTSHQSKWLNKIMSHYQSV